MKWTTWLGLPGRWAILLCIWVFEGLQLRGNIFVVGVGMGLILGMAGFRSPWIILAGIAVATGIAVLLNLREGQ